MPMMNSDLKSTIKWLKQKPESIEILNELLSHPLSEFRTSIFNKKPIWERLMSERVGGALRFIDNWTNDVADGLKLDGAAEIGLLSRANEALNFTTIHQRAAEKRVELALDSTTDEQLEGIITATDNGALRNLIAEDSGKLKFGNTEPPLIFSDWENQKTIIFPNETLDNIRKLAKQKLLVRKMQAADNGHLNSLILAINHRGREEDRTAAIAQAARDLGINVNAAALMTFASISDPNNTVISEAAKKHALTQIPPIVLNTTILNSDTATFKTNFTFGRHLEDREIPELKKALGLRFLKEKLLEVPKANTEQLKRIAGLTVEADIRTQLQAIPSVYGTPALPDNSYIPHAVVQENLATIKDLAAKQALTLTVESASDIKALDALIGATTLDGLKSVLATHESLGFKTDESFRQAFTTITNLDQIRAAAFVRKSILNATQEQLTELVKSNDSSYLNRVFGGSVPGSVQGEVTTFLGNPANLTRMQEQAFIQVAKAKFAEPGKTEADLLNFIGEGDTGRIQDFAESIVNHANSRTLANYAVVDRQPFVNELKAYAAAEHAVKHTAIIAAGNLATEKGYVNNKFGAMDNAALIQNHLPLTEQHLLQSRLVQNIVKNTPKTELDQLKALGEAKNITEFTAKLSTFGITNPEWVNEASMKAVQNEAATRALILQITNHSRFATHPALETFLASLPLEKKQALLAKPQVLGSLMDARTEDAVRDILNDKKIENAAITPLILENKAIIDSFAWILNPKVAEVLSQFRSELSVQEIAGINKIIYPPLTNPPGVVGDPFSVANYPTTMQSIYGLLPGIDEAQFKVAFNLTDHGWALIPPLPAGGAPHPPSINDAINTQHGNNQNVFQYAFPPSPAGGRTFVRNIAKEELARLLLNLTKNAALTDGHIDDILRLVNNSKDVGAFIKEATKLGTPPYFTEQTLKKELTPELFNETKRAITKARLEKKETQSQVINEQKARLNAIKKTIKSDKKIHDALEDLADIEAIDWLNPIYHAKAMQNARETLPLYKAVDEVCEAQIVLYKEKLHVINEQLASIPQPYSTLPGAVQKHRQFLNAEEAATRKQLKRYEKVQTLLRGNPDPRVSKPFLKQGLLKTLEEAKQGTATVKWSDTKYIVDNIPKSELQGLRQKRGYVEGKKSIPQSHARLGTKPTLEKGKDLKADEAQIIRTTTYAGTHAFNSSFGVERQIVTEINKQTNQIEYVARGSVSLIDYAKPANPGVVPPEEPQTQANIAASLDLAKAYLFNFPSPPEEPAFLEDGMTEEEAKYIWMALLVIGEEKATGKKFGREHIKVSSSCPFNPTGYKISNWGRDTPEFKAFKNSPSVQEFIEEVREFKKGEQSKEAIKMQERAESSAEKTVSYRKTMAGTRNEDLAEKIKAAQEETTPTLGNS